MENTNFEMAIAAYKANPSNENTVAVLQARIEMSQAVAQEAIEKYQTDPSKENAFWCKFHTEARDKEFLECMMLMRKYS